jgi:hypothetical protein
MIVEAIFLKDFSYWDRVVREMFYALLVLHKNKKVSHTWLRQTAPDQEVVGLNCKISHKQFLV